MADGGELIVLAPGVRRFGEDPAIDQLIRKYGYSGTANILKLMGEEEEFPGGRYKEVLLDPEMAPGVKVRIVEQATDLQAQPGAAAHLIHGSTDGRFTVTYCPEHLTREEVEGVGFAFAPLGEMTARYDPGRLSDGWNTMPDGERIFYISNPALGLWAHRARFESGREAQE